MGPRDDVFELGPRITVCLAASSPFQCQNLLRGKRTNGVREVMFFLSQEICRWENREQDNTMERRQVVIRMRCFPSSRTTTRRARL